VDATTKPQIAVRAGEPLLSPLRYPGSKRRLVDYVRKTIALNMQHVDIFIEPFAGGASVALQLLCDGVVDRIGLADIDPMISSFWWCVFYDTEWLVRVVEDAVITIDNWYKVKHSEPRSRRDMAFKCLFLNRTSFSGILSPSAGPIGGKKQQSAYDLGCRFPKSKIVKRIRQAQSLRDRVAFVWNCDWAECIVRLRELRRDYKPTRVFLYLDPPFYRKAEKLYTFYFTQGDHEALHRSLARLPYSWLLSYDVAEPIRSLYTSNGTRPRRIEMLHSASAANGTVSASELIITNLRRLPTKTRQWQTRVERTTIE
jgi:DNA adenine methylase